MTRFNRGVLRLITALAGIGAACAVTVPAGAKPRASAHQGEGATHRHAAPKKKLSATEAKIVLTDEGLTDAILADVLNNLTEQTDRHFHKGEYNHIVNLNRLIVQGDPHNLAAYENSSYLLWSMQRNAEGLAFLQQGLKDNTNTFYLYDEVGLFYSLYLKDYKSAIPYYEKAVTFKDCAINSWHGLAHCYEKTHQMDKALKTWETAAKRPGDVVAAVNLKRVRAIAESHSPQ